MGQCAACTDVMTPKLLMIEDDQALAAMVVEYLGQRGIEVEARHTGADGLAALKTHDFDALTLDVMLPDADGFELCRQIRSHSDVPIIMLTARGDEMDRIVGLELGADDYLPKPFNPRELLARIKAVVRRRGSMGETKPRLQFGRLRIDRERREVSIADEGRVLTAHQFDLLVTLAEHAGKVLSRDRLMHELRGHDLDAFDRSIDVHISRIRSAIEDDPKTPRRIITLRGAGYVFASEQD